ncbi:protein DEK isoform X2 [Hoplias malabaricus]
MESQEEHAKEEVNDGSDKEESLEDTSKSRTYQDEIVEGKRERKSVQRLDMQGAKPKEKLKIESIGQGDKLGDIPRVNHAIGRLKAPLLKPLHKILYDRPGAAASLRKNLRLFNGFQFEMDSDSYHKKKEKMTRLHNVELRTMCQILDLERSGNQGVLVDRIMHFLIKPTNSGKPVILKKKKKKKTTKDAKREKKSTSRSKKQQPESRKSKAIVTDLSSDEEDDDDDEGKVQNKDESTSVLVSEEHSDVDSSEEEEEEVKEKDSGSDDASEESDSEENKPSSKKKFTPKKAVKKVEDTSDQSLSDDDDDSADEFVSKKTKKKPTVQKKTAPKPVSKSKKADSSSSNRKRNTASKSKVKSDSSDDDVPLIKMTKKPPNNEQLQDAIKGLLKSANLEVVTMKKICQQVYDLYPEFDLTDKKDFIKDTVKELIS